MLFVADASPLLYAARAEILDILFRTLGTMGITPAVYREAIEQGERRGYRDARLLRKELEKERLVLLKLSREEERLSLNLQAESNLDASECETIACARVRGLTALLHDRKACRLAAAVGVSTLRLPNALLLALIREVVSLAEFTEAVEKAAVVMGMDVASLQEWKMIGKEISRQWRR